MSDKTDPTDVRADENTEVEVEDLKGADAAYTLGTAGCFTCPVS
ncbi:hypothetical protein ACIRBY_12625 [Streptomyces sp. NPDC096136]